jgi:two-component system nitrate/nitrite response regulator NarL
VQSQKVRILIIEDFIPFQKMIQWILEEKPDYQIIGTASDGVEGVRKAEELQPDLILLDIGLPRMNGIEAARNIGKNFFHCKILFVTQESSAEYVRKTLRMGAHGYVLKERVVSDLLPAMRAALKDATFVSSGLSLDSSSSSDESPPETHPCRDLTSLPLNSRGAVQFSCHSLHVYSDEAILLQRATNFVANAIRTEQSAIVVASESLRHSLSETAGSGSVDIHAAVRKGNYISLHVEEINSLFMFNGSPDPIRFTEFLGGLIAAAAQASHAASPRVALFAECATLLWRAGNADGAMRLEQLWNKLATRHDVNILCAYPITNFHGEDDCDLIRKLCAEHSVIDSR